MTHTPGPWSLGEDMRGTLRVFAERNEVVRALSRHGARHLPKKERLANARLIAAAPDLLAALKGAVDFIECVASETEDFAYAHKLRDIIAKAEGR